jgi:hypothetical protein
MKIIKDEHGLLTPWKFGRFARINREQVIVLTCVRCEDFHYTIPTEDYNGTARSLNWFPKIDTHPFNQTVYRHLKYVCPNCFFSEEMRQVYLGILEQRNKLVKLADNGAPRLLYRPPITLPKLKTPGFTKLRYCEEIKQDIYVWVCAHCNWDRATFSFVRADRVKYFPDKKCFRCATTNNWQKKTNNSVMRNSKLNQWIRNYARRHPSKLCERYALHHAAFVQEHEEHKAAIEGVGKRLAKDVHCHKVDLCWFCDSLYRGTTFEILGNSFGFPT